MCLKLEDGFDEPLDLLERTRLDKLFESTPSKVRFETSEARTNEQDRDQPHKIFSLEELSQLFRKAENPLKSNPILLGSWAAQIQEADLFPLTSLLETSNHLNRSSSLYLAVNLTWNAICLMNTQWFEDGPQDADIFFARRGEKLRLDTPFIRRNFNQKIHEQTDVHLRIEHQVCRLGIILCELSLRNSIEDHEKSQQLDALPQGLREPVFISPILDRVYEESGQRYGEVVRTCLRFDISTNKSGTDQSTLRGVQRWLISEVLIPLQEQLEAFGIHQSNGTFEVPLPKSTVNETHTPGDENLIGVDGAKEHEQSTTFSLKVRSLEDLPLVCQYASSVCRRYDPATFALSQSKLAGKSTFGRK